MYILTSSKVYNKKKIDKRNKVERFVGKTCILRIRIWHRVEETTTHIRNSTP